MERSDGLFQRGKHPSPEMLTKFRAAQQRRRAADNAERQRQLDEFIAKIQALIDDCYARTKPQ